MKLTNKVTGEKADVSSLLNREAIENIIEEAVKKTINNSINEMTKDLMMEYSLSLGEAQHIASTFLISGVTPKSREFYKRASEIKTLWEV